jgi:hypothetical protein
MIMATYPLRDYINSKCGTSLPDELPLVHTSRCELASSIIATPELQPRQCDIYDEDLLYLFYGRPAYRIKDRGFHDIGYCPICFILKLNRSSLGLKRVMPIDSGGVAEGRFSPHIEPWHRDLLELDTSVDGAQKLVDVLYKDNRSYLYGACQPLDQFVDAPNVLVTQYVKMLHDAEVSKADDRRSVVEFQATTTVSLKDDLQAVVLPEALLDQFDLRRTILNEWNALPITYPTFEATSPSDYTPVIRDRVVTFYQTYHFVRE